MVTQAQIDSLPWYHEFKFADGLKATPSDRSNVIFYRTLCAFIRDQLAQIDLAGKSVIDIGCWDGYFSFFAEEQGAKSVLAVDDYSQNWGTPDAFRLVKALKNSSVELRPDVSVYELERIQQQFDVVLLFGVYYHLHAPLAAVAGMRALCHDDSLALIEGACIRDEEQSHARYSLDNPGEKFIPTTRLLREMLEACYFKVERMAFLSEVSIAERLALAPPSEVLQLAKRALKTKQEHDTAPPTSAEPRDRVMLFVRPVREANRYHRYKPPFGLERFDTRTF